jgi:hypothetical protein
MTSHHLLPCCAWKKLVNFSTPDDAYLIVPTPDGRAVWQAHGSYSDGLWTTSVPVRDRAQFADLEVTFSGLRGPKCFMRDGRPEDIGINQGRLDSPQGGQDEYAHIFPCTESKQNFTVDFPEKSVEGLSLERFWAILCCRRTTSKVWAYPTFPRNPSGAD